MARLPVVLFLCLLAGLSDCQKQGEENESNISDLNNHTVDGNEVKDDVLTEDVKEDQENDPPLSINSPVLMEALQEKLLATVQALEATNKKLEANEEKLTALSQTVANLRSRDQGQDKIAFSVAHPIEGTITSANVAHSLVYDRVLSNIGGHYNQHTGFFTAPVKGVYFFTFTSFCWAGDVRCGGSLYRNGRALVSWYVNKPPKENSKSNSAILLLNTGDHVNVRLWDRSRISDNGHLYSTFSGFLLFTM